MTPRVVMWVQSRMGLGHLARALTLCGAMAEDGFDVTLAHGGPPAPALPVPPRVRFVQLPVAVAPDLQSPQISDVNGRAIDEAWMEIRREALKSVLSQVKPHAFLTETFPLGRRLFSFELLPVLKWLRERSPRPLIVASVRDVVTRPEKSAKAEAMVDLALQVYDLILCHSDPRIIRLPDAFPETRRLEAMTRYSGYVVAPPSLPAQARRGVMVVAGGGAAGSALFETAMAAHALWPDRDQPWTIVAGPRFDAGQLERLRSRAPRGVDLLGPVEGLAKRYASTALVVSQAGYNSVCEVLAHGAKLTVVPYATAKETEQTIRAKIFSRLALLTMVREADLSPYALAMAMATARDAAAPRVQLAFDGAIRTAQILREAIKARID